MRTRHHIFSQLHPGKSILCSCCMALIVCLFTACDSKQSTSTKPTLTVTLEPLRYFTETIAGDKFKIVSMVPKGSSPETYDPTPQQLVNLDKSTAYLRIGYIGFEQAWMDKLTTNAPHLKVFDTHSSGVRREPARFQAVGLRCQRGRLSLYRCLPRARLYRR